MRRRIHLPRLTYANVVATLALFIALGGASYAALKIPKGSVGSKQIKDKGVLARDLGRGSVGPKQLQGNAVGFDNLGPDSVDSSKIKDSSIARADVDANDFAPRLFAHVSANGVLGDNAGADGVSRTATGAYVVNFNRDLDNCVATASSGFGFGAGPGGVDSIPFESTASVSMNPAGGGGSAVRVETRRIDFNQGIGTTYEPKLEALTYPVDTAFNLIVAC